jgi:hypothetical protein
MKRTLFISVVLSIFGSQISRAATSLFPGPDYVVPGAPPAETGPANGPQGLTRYPGTMWERELLLGDLNDLRNQILNRGFSFSPILIQSKFRHFKHRNRCARLGDSYRTLRDGSFG